GHRHRVALEGGGGGRGVREDAFGSQRDQFFSGQLYLIGTCRRRKAVVDAKVAAFQPSTLFQSMPKSREPCPVFGIVLREASHYADCVAVDQTAALAPR